MTCAIWKQFFYMLKEHITTTKAATKPVIVSNIVTIGPFWCNSQITTVDVPNMAKDDNLGYDIEEDFENDFDENPNKDFCPPLNEGTSDNEKDFMEAPSKQ